MQEFKTFDDLSNKESLSGPTWEEYNNLLTTVNSLLETVNTLSPVITTLQSTVTDLQTKLDNVGMETPIRILSLDLADLISTDGSTIDFSDLMEKLTGVNTGDFLAVVRRGSAEPKTQKYKESHGNYISCFTILDGNSFRSNSSWWFNGSEGNSEFDVNWGDRMIDNAYAVTYAFFSRH